MSSRFCLAAFPRRRSFRSPASAAAVTRRPSAVATTTACKPRWKNNSLAASTSSPPTHGRRHFSDAADLLNGGSIGNYRAVSIPGFGIGKDRGLADFDIRNVFHFSGGYALPFGTNKKFMNGANGVTNAIVGGWSLNWIATLEGGQPLRLNCPVSTTSGTNCNSLNVPGQ